MNYSPCANNSLGAITNVCTNFRSTTQTYSLARSSASNDECIQKLLLRADRSVNIRTFRSPSAPKPQKRAFQQLLVC